MKPLINLCLFNCRRFSVLDQIWFAESVFRQNGYEVIQSNVLRSDCMNLLIENFTAFDIHRIDSFCKKFPKQVGILMTEHIEVVDGILLFDGRQLADPEYISNRQHRLLNLLSISDLVFAFFTLGELPQLRGWNEILLDRGVYRLPYPSITWRCDPTLRRREYDIIFTGHLTEHRTSILKQLQREYHVCYSEFVATETQRAELYSRSKVAVTIPQTADWRWTSPMRTMFGLRFGLPTVDLGYQRDDTGFSRLVLGPIHLSGALQNPEELYKRQISAYQQLRNSCHNPPFPSVVFDAWREIEL